MSRIAPTKGRYFDQDPIIRDEGFIKSADGRACDVPECQNRNVVGHHIRKGSGHGIGQQPSDADLLFLCGHHHTGPAGIHHYPGGEEWFVLRVIVVPLCRARHARWLVTGKDEPLW